MNIVEIISEMRKLHIDVEDQFLSFNRIVPYNHNPGEVYSPRLYSILQNACAQVISMMNAITKRIGSKTPMNVSIGKKEKQRKFDECYNFLNQKLMLAVQSVAPREKIEMTIRPFKFKQNVPIWWQQYNNTKHQLPEGAYVGTIRNVMNALAAVTILHHIAEHMINLRDASRILASKNWRDNSKEVREDYQRLKHTIVVSGALHTAQGGFLSYKSRVFLYLYEFHPVKENIE